MKKLLKGTVGPILTTLVFAFIFTTFCAKMIIIQGDSMNPTYKNGQVGFSLVVHDFMDIKRNDVVSIKVTDNDQKKVIIKRVIGLPGEKIECKDNVIYINDEPIEQNYLSDTSYTEDFVMQLGDDEYYALGDNRIISKDSRYYGTFSKDQFLTKGTLMMP